MKSDVGVRQLRQHLSVYLARVRRGETLTVTDRRQVVALLAPATRAEDAVGRLIAAGRARAPKRAPSDRPRPLRSKGPALSRLVLELGEDTTGW